MMSIGLCHSYLHECVCITSVLKFLCYYVQEEKKLLQDFSDFIIMNLFTFLVRLVKPRKCALHFLKHWMRPDQLIQYKCYWNPSKQVLLVCSAEESGI